MPIFRRFGNKIDIWGVFIVRTLRVFLKLPKLPILLFTTMNVRCKMEPFG